MTETCQPEAPGHTQSELRHDLNGQPQEHAKARINLSGVAQTLFIPLIARASDAVSSNAILGDPYAQNTIDKLSFDQDAMTMTPFQCAGVCLRTSQFDKWTTAFLMKHPCATVVHLACGLDSRMQRVPWTNTSRWFDIDLPKVIELRKQVLPTSIPDRDYSLIAANVLEHTWIKNIPNDRPVLIIMEGLLSYLLEDEVKGLLLQLCQSFKHGEMIFECISTIVLKRVVETPLKVVSETGAIFQWATDDPKSLEGIYTGVRLAESVCFVEASGVEKFALSNRVIMYLMSWIPSLRKAAQFLRFEFGGDRE
ncbi:hypothetical protein N7448_010456 [Penicillium atrosanguineum]|uniref:S-adenosyl-L-methionine-dependent methyltransferase n=1 Tax=Penicillium atrosanguineum TaxID=1132637 RepID=A0A9W9GHG0_9EURO|nr:uncharacterized protein N7443_007680 [Penicillium atrosanguineum]KAJ5118748.1 hypothetical protein N7526_010385 [Penicillium atrosanguineum]KAJ5119787.1 hypothetical protein N7448_010456 [Penicillium atrosanguineum]KAJ5296787.1 hypothetical protein N7443_007680 [Penicillium atrosanguineum]KAJ5299547.1 hypothetical protein N7476_011104 [Penicillium atrosanguineum]